MIVRSKDLPLSADKQASREQRAAQKEAAAVREQLAKKKWKDLSDSEREDLLRAIAIHLGFIAPD